MGGDDLRLFTPREVAEILRVKPQRLLELCRAGELSYIDVGGGRKKVRRMFEREDVEKFIARRRRTEQWQKHQKISTAVRTRRSGMTSSSSAAVDFVALLKQRRNEKPGKSSSPSGKPSPKK